MGSIEAERITFNEKTLWRGGPNTSAGADAYWNVNKQSAHYLNGQMLGKMEKVKGLCAKGNFELDIRWKERQFVFRYYSFKDGGNCELRYKDDKFVLKTVKSKTYTLNYINGKFVPING